MCVGGETCRVVTAFKVGRGNGAEFAVPVVQRRSAEEGRNGRVVRRKPALHAQQRRVLVGVAAGKHVGGQRSGHAACPLPRFISLTEV